MELNKQELTCQLSILKDLLSQPSTDVCWSSYDSPLEVIRDLNMLEKGIANNDRTSIEKLLFMLAPTNDLQEISICSGWGHEFLGISKAIETVLTERE